MDTNTYPLDLLPECVARRVAPLLTDNQKIVASLYCLQVISGYTTASRMIQLKEGWDESASIYLAFTRTENLADVAHFARLCFPLTEWDRLYPYQRDYTAKRIRIVITERPRRSQGGGAYPPAPPHAMADFKSVVKAGRSCAAYQWHDLLNQAYDPDGYPQLGKLTLTCDFDPEEFPRVRWTNPMVERLIGRFVFIQPRGGQEQWPEIEPRTKPGRDSDDHFTEVCRRIPLWAGARHRIYPVSRTALEMFIDWHEFITYRPDTSWNLYNYFAKAKARAARYALIHHVSTDIDNPVVQEESMRFGVWMSAWTLAETITHHMQYFPDPDVCADCVDSVRGYINSKLRRK